MDRFLHYYYKFTAYSPLANDASFQERERVRRSRLASVVIVFAIALVLIAVPASINTPVRLAILSIVTIIDIFALLIVNRLGKVTLAGAIVVSTIEVGLISATLNIVGGIKLSDILMIDMLVQGTAVAFAVLPLSFAICVTLFNIGFIFWVLQFGPRAQDLFQWIAASGHLLFTQLLTVQIIVAVVMLLLVHSTSTALRQADKSDELAKLRQLEVERQQQEIQTKRQIEEGIERILSTLGAVSATSDFSKLRVPLAESNILWRVGRSVNLMLSRLQGFKGEHETIERTEQIAIKLAEAMRKKQPYALSNWTGTPLDRVILEYNNSLKHDSVPQSGPFHTTH